MPFPFFPLTEPFQTQASLSWDAFQLTVEIIHKVKLHVAKLCQDLFFNCSMVSSGSKIVLLFPVQKVGACTYFMQDQTSLFLYHSYKNIKHTLFILKVFVYRFIELFTTYVHNVNINFKQPKKSNSIKQSYTQRQSKTNNFVLKQYDRKLS